MAYVCALTFAVGLHVAFGEVLKVGGIIGSTGMDGRGKAAFELWKTAINAKKTGWSSLSSPLGYVVQLVWFSDVTAENMWPADIAARVAGTVNACEPNCLDVMICPYSTAKSKKCVDSMPAGATIPILIWGGAADDIFTVNCAKFNCFGTFATASTYTTASLDAIYASSALSPNSTFSVGTVTNSNGFSASLNAGTNAWISGKAGVTLKKAITLSVAQAALKAADIEAVNTVIAESPDVIVIHGHSGDVEQVVMQLRSSPTYTAKAIICINAFSNTEKYGSRIHLLKGVIMPDQWEESATATDTILAWTTETFKAAMKGLSTPQTASYHAASAAGAALAISYAMADGSEGNRRTTLIAKLKAFPAAGKQTFYGPISFNSDGSMKAKPMYGRQWVEAASAANIFPKTVIMPPNTNLVYPMPESGVGEGAAVVSGSQTLRAFLALSVCLCAVYNRA